MGLEVHAAGHQLSPYLINNEDNQEVGHEIWKLETICKEYKQGQTSN